MSETIQSIIEQKGKLLHELEDMRNGIDKGVEIDQPKLDKILADLEEVDKKKRNLEQINSKLVEGFDVQIPEKDKTKDYIPIRDKLDLFIRGKEYVDGEIRQLSNKDSEFGLVETRAYDWNKTDATGGYLAPDLIADQIAEAQAYIGGMVTPGLCRWIQTSTGNKIEIPVVNDTSTKGAVVAGSTAMTSGSAVTYSVQDLVFYKITSHIATIANELVQDAAFDVVRHVTDLLFTRLYRGLNYYFTHGTSGSHPVGIQSASTKGVDAAKRSITNDNLLDLVYSVNRAYRQGAAWMMNDTTVGAVRRLMIATTDVDVRTMWQDSMQASEPSRLHGFPVYVNPDCDDINQYDKPIFFGDFKRYWIAEALPMKLVRMDEYYKPSDQVGLCVLGRWAGNLAAISGDAPIKHMRNAST